MSDAKTLVTVVAVCYDHSRYLVETLESIRIQTYSNLQVIVIDDCSKDDSVAIIDGWLKENNLDWHFIRHSVNHGLSRTLNETLELAEGQYYKSIACDDILEPDCIERLLTILKDCDQSYAMVYGDARFIDEESVLVGKTSFTSGGWKYGYGNLPSGWVFDKLAEVCFIPAPSVLAKTLIFKELKFNEELKFEDWDMWLRVAKKYKVASIHKPVVRYRIHSQSMFQVKSAEYLDSEMRVAQIHMGFSKAADKFFKQFIYEKSILAYMKGGIRNSYWLWMRFLIKKDTKNFLHVLFAIFGISYHLKEKWRKKILPAWLTF